MGTKSIDRDDSKRLMVFAGTSSKQLGQKIADRLGIELGDVRIERSHLLWRERRAHRRRRREHLSGMCMARAFGRDREAMP